MKSNKNLNNELLRIVVLGKAGVGKSALVVRYLTKRFIWEYDPTLECVYKHQACVDNEPTAIELLDTAGENCNLSSTFEGNALWGDGFIIVYSVVDRHSFEEVTAIKAQLDEIRKSVNIPCIIVGNKVDLEHQRTVSYEEGERLASTMASAFFETSASDGGSTIPETFHEICREIMRRRRGPGSSPTQTEKYSTRRRASAHQQVLQVISRVLTKING